MSLKIPQNLFIYPLTLTLLSGCGGGEVASTLSAALGGGSSSVNVTSITGHVVLGPVQGSACEAFNLSSAGVRGTSLGTAITSSDGSYTILAVPQGAFEVVCKGGSYTDEATGQSVNVDPTLELTAVGAEKADAQYVGVNLLSTLVKQKLNASLSQGANLKTLLSQSKKDVNTMMGLSEDLDPVKTPPTIMSAAVVAPGGDVSTCGQPVKERELGAAIAGLSQFAKDQGLSATEGLIAVRGLIEDLKDGVIDGKLNGVSLGTANKEMQTSPLLPALLKASMANFIASPQNPKSSDLGCYGFKKDTSPKIIDVTSSSSLPFVIVTNSSGESFGLEKDFSGSFVTKPASFPRMTNISKLFFSQNMRYVVSDGRLLLGFQSPVYSPLNQTTPLTGVTDVSFDPNVSQGLLLCLIADKVPYCFVNSASFFDSHPYVVNLKNSVVAGDQAVAAPLKGFPSKATGGVTKIQAQRGNICALGADTKLYCVGDNRFGSTGVKTLSASDTFETLLPVESAQEVAGLGSGVSDFFLGPNGMNYAIKNGALYTWGVMSSTPDVDSATFLGRSNPVAISRSGGIQKDGSMAAPETFYVLNASPTQGFTSNVTAIVSSRPDVGALCVVSSVNASSDKIDCIGLSYQQGPNPYVTFSAAAKVKTLSIGSGTNPCFTSQGGALYCNGENAFDQLKTGITDSNFSPNFSLVSGFGSGVLDAKTFAGAICAIKSGEEPTCWGGAGASSSSSGSGSTSPSSGPSMSGPSMSGPSMSGPSTSGK